jgi:hypothetical protein
MKSLLRRLFGVRGKPGGDRGAGLGTAAAIVESGAPAQGQTLLLLGVDFGTAYTKIVWRHLGGVRVGVAPIGPDGQSMAPSVVWVDCEGGLHADYPGEARAERMLKMRLASGNPRDGDPEDIAALCVFFVGSALRAGMAAASLAFRGASTSLYGAALGCPAEYCDDGRVEVFQRVAAQAWRWAHDASAPRTLGALKIWMADEPSVEAAQLFEARAEVAAAVDCFVMRPDAEIGRYVFLDIGAGTLDGACFKLYREVGRTRITVLATAVAPLGVEMVAQRVGERTGQNADAPHLQLFEPGPLPESDWGQVRSEIGGFIGRLMTQARARDPLGDWLSAADAKPRVWTSLETQADLARRLPVFFGGGGMTSPFYRDTARRAGIGLANNYGIPRLALGEVAPPPGFEGVHDAPFHRFAVAFGLTRPFTEAPYWTLPTRLLAHPTPSPRVVADRLGVDYGSSKDAYE